MAKERDKGHVYPNSPLVISREKFCSLLQEQIVKGEELLKVSVPVVQQFTQYYGYGSTPRADEKVYYEKSEEKKFGEDYKRWKDRNMAVYRTSFEESESIYYHEFESQIYGIWGADTVKEYKQIIQRQINQMQSDIERSDLFKCVEASDLNFGKKNPTNTEVLTNEIFIVHGHSEEMKQVVARTVTRLGLKPIILHEQANGGKTIIDKFESNAQNIRFAIILLSADDKAASVKDLDGVDDSELRNRLEKRARQNVVFEMGYFVGKLGRSSMFFLLQEGVSKPGDLDGIVYTVYDVSGAWKFQLVKELKCAGYDVSADMLL